MDPNQALNHAAVVCREAAKLGLADQAALKSLYQEYTTFLKQGVRGSFTQLLRSRGVVNDQSYEALKRAVLASSHADMGESRNSGVVQLGGSPQLPQGLSLGPPLPVGKQAPARKATEPYVSVMPTPEEQVVAERTLEFDRVIPVKAPAAIAAPDLMRTVADDQVLQIGQPEQELAIPDDLELKIPDDPLELSNATPASDPGPIDFAPRLGARTPSASDPGPMGMTFDVLESNEIGSTADSQGSHGSQGSQGSQGSDGSRGEEIVPPTGLVDLFASSGDGEEEEVDPPAVGDVVGAYTLVGTVGRGGMGVIFKGQKNGTEEFFALKILLGAQDLGADRRRQRFRREVEAMRRLEHENVVGVYDYGRHGPFDWYTMDLVEGKDFEKLLEQGGMEPREKMQVFEDICAAMAHAHERSVIHRDLKPQNVLVNKRTGRGHVLDFGLAKILDQGIGMTRTGSALGTPFYMAPEQLKSAKHIDARADVFSLGVILYEISTGTRPFLGNTAAEVGNKILTTEPPAPTLIKPDLHPDIDAIVSKALEKDPEHRYPDAGALYADLIKHRKGFGVEGQTGIRKLQRFLERNRIALVAVGGTAVVFTLLIAILFAFVVKSDDPEVSDKTGKTSKTGKSAQSGGKTGKTDSEKTGKVSKTARPSPSPSKRPSPSPSKRPSPSPSKRPSPSPTKRPSPSPSDTPKPSPTREVARTPLVRAYEALSPPNEAEKSGTQDAVSANDDDARRAMILSLEQGFLPAMAIGDTANAERALDLLRSVPDFTLATLIDEMRNDVKTLKLLRNLIGEALKANERKRLPNLELYGGERLDNPKSFEVLTGGYLKLQYNDRWLELDPCALVLRSVAELAIPRKPGLDTSAGHYGVAVLGTYRHATEQQLDNHFTAALETTEQLIERGRNAVKHRRAFVTWLTEARAGAWRELEEKAEAAWRELEGKRRNAKVHARGLEAFVEDFGRTTAYLKRREDWLAYMAKHRKLSDLLDAKKSSTPQVRWLFKDKNAYDFELLVADEDSRSKTPRPFRAELRRSGFEFENGRLQLELFDLLSQEGLLEVSSKTDGLIEVFHSGVTQAIDPSTGWKILFRGKTLKGASDTKSRKFKKSKQVQFRRNDKEELRDFFIRLPQTKLSVPAKEFATRGRRSRDGMFLGAQAKNHLRIERIELEWRRNEQEEKAEKLRRALVERRLLGFEADKGLPQGFVLARNQPQRLTGFMLEGGWKPGKETLEGEGDSALWTTQYATYGVLEFELAMTDGPGARLVMTDSTKRSSNAIVWRLPDLLNSDPERSRKVRVFFNLEAGFASVLVDGIRLQTHGDKLPKKAYFGIRSLGRTQVKLRDLRLVQFRPRK